MDPKVSNRLCNTPRESTEWPIELPNRPRFLAGLVLIKYPDGLIVDGTDRVQLLQGDAARFLIPDLAPLMDGSRTLEQIQSLLPSVPAEHVRAAIAKLYQCGVVDNGTSNLIVDPVPDTLGFFRRHVGVRRFHPSAEDAYRELQMGEVLVVDSSCLPDMAALLKHLLEETGVSRVVSVSRQAFGTWDPAMTSYRPLVVSLCFGQEDSQWHSTLDDWCREKQLPWLRVVAHHDGKHSDIGPLFKNEETPCYGCFCVAHLPLRFPTHPPCQEIDPIDALFWIGMAAVEIVYYLSDIAPLVSARGLRRYDTEGWTETNLRCYRVPGCRHCRPLTKDVGKKDAFPSMQGKVETPFLFEDYVGFPSHSSSFQTFRSAIEQSQLGIALASSAKSFPNCEEYILNSNVPVLDGSTLDLLAMEANTVDVAGSCTMDQLGLVFKMTGGVRKILDGQVLRWASTAGNLGSVELFLLAYNVEGLPRGLYFYQSHKHSFARVRRRGEKIGVDELMHRLIPAISNNLPDALVFFTGAYYRLAEKYEHLAYRLLYLDAGVALSQLHLVSGASGIRSWTIVCADDLIESYLNLDYLREQSTAAVALSGTSQFQPQFSGSFSPSNCSPQPVSLEPPCDFRGVGLDQLVETLYRESRLTEKDYFLKGPDGFLPRTKSDMGHSGSITLSRPGNGGRRVSEVLDARNSIRRYRETPVSSRQLSTMIDCASRGDSRDWPEENICGNSLKYLLLALKVEHIDAGVYCYDVKQQTLSVLRSPIHSTDLLSLFVQPEFACAPAIVLVTGNLVTSCARLGAFGHRQLLLRGGAAAQRLWMAAMALGLSGCLSAGLIQEGARRLLGLDGYNEIALLALTTGYRDV